LVEKAGRFDWLVMLFLKGPIICRAGR